MKKTIFQFIFLIFIINTSTAQTQYDVFDTIKRIDIFYLSWNYYPNIPLKENDIRNFDNKNAFYQTSNKDTIDEFLKALNVMYFEEIKYRESNVYMVIDLIFSQNNIKTILVTKSKSVLST